MFTERRDYLLDMIQQLVQRITELLQRAQGQQVELEALERECERAMDDEFAVSTELLRAPATAGPPRAAAGSPPAAGAR